jgi:hypothetical protein
MTGGVIQGFAVGKYFTECGYEAEVVAVADDGMLIGRYNVQTKPEHRACWMAGTWYADGTNTLGIEGYRLTKTRERIPVHRSYWLNIYQSGPGLLRDSWEHSLIEASREDSPPLCRVEVKVHSFVGEGL